MMLPWTSILSSRLPSRRSTTASFSSITNDSGSPGAAGAELGAAAVADNDAPPLSACAKAAPQQLISHSEDVNTLGRIPDGCPCVSDPQHSHQKSSV